MVELFAAEGGANFLMARTQMALSLGWHIVFACFGIASRRSSCSPSGWATGALTPH